MKLVEFRVRNYRNVIDSGWIKLTNLTALVGQNESGKSNLCEALYRLNPFEREAAYLIDEDWPADDWGGRNAEAPVCEGRFIIEDAEEIEDLYTKAAPKNGPTAEGEQTSKEPKSKIPSSVELLVTISYNGQRIIEVSGDLKGDLRIRSYRVRRVGQG
jgi:hypothetical protein